MVDPESGRPLLWGDEETEARETAEERVRLLEEELARLRRQSER